MWWGDCQESSTPVWVHVGICESQGFPDLKLENKRNWSHWLPPEGEAESQPFWESIRCSWVTLQARARLNSPDDGLVKDTQDKFSTLEVRAELWLPDKPLTSRVPDEPQGYCVQSLQHGVIWSCCWCVWTPHSSAGQHQHHSLSLEPPQQEPGPREATSDLFLRRACRRGLKCGPGLAAFCSTSSLTKRLGSSLLIHPVSLYKQQIDKNIQRVKSITRPLRLPPFTAAQCSGEEPKEGPTVSLPPLQVFFLAPLSVDDSCCCLYFLLQPSIVSSPHESESGLY